MTRDGASIGHMRQALLLALLLGCGRRVQASPDAGAELVDASPTAPKAVPVDAIDPPMSVKKTERVSVTFNGTSGLRAVPPTKTDPGTRDSVLLVFAIQNDGDDELPINGLMSTQATTVGGLPGELSDNAHFGKKCLGIAPPRGKFVCSVVYHFDAPPKELRVRVEGAWFHVAVDWKDAG